MSHFPPWLQKPLRLPYHPRAYFGVFLSANLLLAYSPLGLSLKCFVGMAGILAPLALAFLTAPPSKGEIPGSGGPAAWPSWVWALALSLAAGLRLFWIPTLTAWPMWDDASWSYYSIGQAHDWHWRLFYSSESDPPLFFWTQALFYKLVPPSLASLWLFPALLSVLALAAGAWALRRWFPSSLSSYGILILAFGFWPLFVGSFSQMMVLFLAWEWLCLGLLGLGWGSKDARRRLWAAFGLGISLGLGFYIWIMALPVILVVAGVFLWDLRRSQPARGSFLPAFGLPLLVLALPIFLGILRNILAGHVRNYLLFSGAPSPGQALVSLSYPTALLWGCLDKSYFNFGPLWGGYLNPVFGAAFLLGAVEVYRLRRKVYFYGLAGLLALGLLPGIVSTTVEVMRILPLLPLVLALTAFGWNCWVVSLPLNWRGWGLVLSAVLAIGLDLYHLGGPYHQWAVPGAQSRDSKSPERYRAFQVLEQVQAREGPGLVLTEFVPDIFDQSLLVTSYPFNAARNPALDPQKTRWAAVLAAHCFEPYFQKHFPDVRSYPLYADLPALEGRLALFLFPLDDSDRPAVEKWLEAHRRIEGLFGLMPYHVPRADAAPAIRLMESSRDSFGGDSFLQCSYWDKLSDLQARDPRFTGGAFQSLEKGIGLCRSDPSLRWEEEYFWERLGKVFHDHGAGDPAAVDALRQSLGPDGDTPAFYKKLALCETNLGNYQDALWAVGQCRRLAPSDPSLGKMAEWLQARAQAEETKEKGNP